ncbi:hypothetical protein GCM10009573_30280 [Agromyces bracchium]
MQLSVVPNPEPFESGDGCRGEAAADAHGANDVDRRIRDGEPAFPDLNELPLAERGPECPARHPEFIECPVGQGAAVRSKDIGGTSCWGGRSGLGGGNGRGCGGGTGGDRTGGGDSGGGGHAPKSGRPSSAKATAVHRRTAARHPFAATSSQDQLGHVADRSPILRLILRIDHDSRARPAAGAPRSE